MACNAVSQSTEQQCSALITYAEAHPADAKAATYAASMLLRENAGESQVERARKLLAAAEVADPKLPDAQYQLGLLKQSQGDWDGSVAPLERSIALKPQLAQAHYRLALAYWRTGRKQDAQKQMDLEKQYAAAERDDLDRRLRQISTFVVDVKNEATE
jgi:tetratricopeptide (TPR) repeat protein